MTRLQAAIVLMNRNPDVRHVITTAVVPDPNDVLRITGHHLPGFESGLEYIGDTAFKVGRQNKPEFRAGGYQSRSEESLEAERKNAVRLSAIRHNQALVGLYNQRQVYYSKVGFIHKDHVSEYLARRIDLFHATVEYDEVRHEQRGVLVEQCAVRFPNSEIANNLIQIRIKANNYYFAYGNDGISPAPLLAIPDRVTIRCDHFLRCLEYPIVKHKILNMIDGWMRERAFPESLTGDHSPPNAPGDHSPPNAPGDHSPPNAPGSARSSYHTAASSDGVTATSYHTATSGQTSYHTAKSSSSTDPARPQTAGGRSMRRPKCMK